MLADDLMDPYKFALATPRLEKVINGATRFVLDREFAAAAMVLARDNRRVPDNMRKILPLCRLPAPDTWMEVVHLDRVAGGWPTGDLRDFQVIPSRVGLLFRQSRKSQMAYTMYLFWRCEAHAEFPVIVNTTATMQLIDLEGSTVLELDRALQATREKLHLPPVKTVKGDLLDVEQTASRERFQGLPADVQATWEDISRQTLALPSDFGPLALVSPDDPRARDLLALSLLDWAGEFSFWMSVLAMLSSRNLVALEAGPDLAKLNRHRAKSGKRPLMPYSTVVIDRRLRAKVAGKGEGDHPGMRSHFVRGHFKIRKTGIFWWMPFHRGDPDLGTVTRDHYEARR